MCAHPRQRTSVLPGIVVSLVVLSLGVMVWPEILGKFVSLDWEIGDMHTVAYGLGVALFLLFLLSLTLQSRINALYARTFPTRKKLVFTTVALLLSLAVGLAASEIVFRILNFPLMGVKTPSENALAAFDEELGWSYIPNHFSIQKFGTAQREVPMYFNDIGARVREPGYTYDPEAPTVLFSGDSYTMGHGLFYEETFVGRLESHPEFPFQVVNLGVQGYGTDQALLLLKRHFKKFNTKVVVYTIMCDDIYRNAVSDRRIQHPMARMLGTKPKFALAKDGSLYLEKKPCRIDELHYLRAWALIKVVWARVGPKPTLELTKALIKEMRNYVESNGAKFILMYWDQGPIPDLDVTMIDTYPNSPPGWGSWEWRIEGDGHYNAKAHDRIARIVVEEFKRLGLTRELHPRRTDTPISRRIR